MGEQWLSRVDAIRAGDDQEVQKTLPVFRGQSGLENGEWQTRQGLPTT